MGAWLLPVFVLIIRFSSVISQHEVITLHEETTTETSEAEEETLARSHIETKNAPPYTYLLQSTNSQQLIQPLPNLSNSRSDSNAKYTASKFRPNEQIIQYFRHNQHPIMLPTPQGHSSSLLPVIQNIPESKPSKPQNPDNQYSSEGRSTHQSPGHHHTRSDTKLIPSNNPNEGLVPTPGSRHSKGEPKQHTNHHGHVRTGHHHTGHSGVSPAPPTSSQGGEKKRPFYHISKLKNHIRNAFTLNRLFPNGWNFPVYSVPQISQRDVDDDDDNDDGNNAQTSRTENPPRGHSEEDYSDSSDESDRKHDETDEKKHDSDYDYYDSDESGQNYIWNRKKNSRNKKPLH